jgi:hypothetical protein
MFTLDSSHKHPRDALTQHLVMHNVLGKR